MRVVGHAGIHVLVPDFPSFSEGLSLRGDGAGYRVAATENFPSFSEGLSLRAPLMDAEESSPKKFPFLFGGTFIEGLAFPVDANRTTYFPSFSEGLSLRASPR